jgi:hypothetical protein
MSAGVKIRTGPPYAVRSAVSIGSHQKSVDVTSSPPGRRSRAASRRYAWMSTPCSTTLRQAIAAKDRSANVVRVRSIGWKRIGPVRAGAFQTRSIPCRSRYP